MPRTKRACVVSRQQPSSVAAAEVANPPRNRPRRGLLSAVPRDTTSSSRQPRSRCQADDDAATWLPDEIILFIFASFLDLADLVRCAATCRRNPMSGEVHVLPPLSGKDGDGHYACTVLTAADYQENDGTTSDDAAIITPPPPHAQQALPFRVVVVYSRRTFTATRRYSSGDGIWGAEAKVTEAHVGKKSMGLMRNGVVARGAGGRTAYWLAGETVFGMHLDTLVAAPPMKVPWSEEREVLDTGNSTLLGTTPKGTLFAVQIRRPFRFELGKRIETIELSVLASNDNGAVAGGYYYGGRVATWEEKFRIRVDQFLPDGALTTKVKLQWFCEMSGLVFFNVSGWYVGGPGQRRSDVYALSFGTRSIQKVASNGVATSMGTRWIRWHTSLPSLADERLNHCMICDR